MPIPKTRAELVASLEETFSKLEADLGAAGPRAGSLPCVDDWSVKDLLAVRVWWTEHVAAWIEAGRAGETPETPAPGYRWKETPRLNADIVSKSRRTSQRELERRLRKGYEHVLEIIDQLDDRQLLEPRVFDWAGSYPISRWISLNTVRQYTTARTYLRRALREAGSPLPAQRAQK